MRLFLISGLLIRQLLTLFLYEDVDQAALLRTYIISGTTESPHPCSYSPALL